MSDDEADPELLELLRQSLGISKQETDVISSDTGVLKDAEYIYSNAIDVSIDMVGTKAAAANLYKIIQQRDYSTQNWGQHDLHPTTKDGFSDIDIVNFVFTMDVLNFSFWSELPEDERYQVEYLDKRWTGYKSLLACLRRALDEGVPITTPWFWNDLACTDEVLRHVFRGATEEHIPLLNERISMLREVGRELEEVGVWNWVAGMMYVDHGQNFGDPDGDGLQQPMDEGKEIDTSITDPSLLSVQSIDQVKSETSTDTFIKEDAHTVSAEGNKPTATPDKTSLAIPGDATSTDQQVTSPTPPNPPKLDLGVVRLIEKADYSAGKLVNLLAKHFPSFRDESRFDGKRIRFLKRAQIFVADLWAAFNGTRFGEFYDIEELTMFADYRVPQMLRSLGVLVYSPPLHHAISRSQSIPSGHSWEVQLRGCSIWAVELVRREILRQHPEAEATGVNAVLIDFLLYDLAKERESAGAGPTGTAAFHRTRSIWY